MMGNSILVISLILIGCALTQKTDSNKKTIGSKECIISNYCSEEGAIKALENQLSMDKTEAAMLVNRYFNENQNRSCSCHDSCVFFDVCCEDKKNSISSHFEPLITRLQTDREAYQCQTLLGLDVLVVNTCPKTAPQALKDRCEQELTDTDKSRELKVTSDETKITYKNLYCGMCNGEKISTLDSWRWNFDCKTLGYRNESVENQEDKSEDIFKLIGSENCQLHSKLSTIPTGMDLPGNNLTWYDEAHQRLNMISLSIGAYLDSLNLCSAYPISKCPAGIDTLISDKCTNGPNAFTVLNDKVYKNTDCLICNEGDAARQSATCESCEFENCRHDLVLNSRDLLGSFAVLVKPYHTSDMISCKDKNGEKCPEIFSEIPPCGHGQFLNYKTSVCENICPPSSYLENDECVFSTTSTECTAGSYTSYNTFSKATLNANTTQRLLGKTFTIVNQELIQCYNCTRLMLSRDISGLQVSSNRTFLYNGREVSSQFIYQKDNFSWYVCLDQAHVVEEVLTMVLLSLSVASLILYFCAYALMKRLRNVPGKIVAGNMLCLLLAYIFFILRTAMEEYSVGCTVIAILIHYFFVASFVFNIIYASFIIHSLEFIDFESSVNSWTAVRMWVLGLLLPFTVIAPALALDTFPDGEYRPGYGGKECFLMNEYGRLLFFIGPMGLLLLIALILYLIILVKLVQVARATSQVRSNHREKVAIAMKLVIVLGFNWMFAIAAAAAPHPVMVTVFIVTCTLQGFFAFIVFICNKATLKDLKKYFGPKKASVEISGSTATKNQSSTMSTDITKTLLRTNDS